MVGFASLRRLRTTVQGPRANDRQMLAYHGAPAWRTQVGALALAQLRAGWPRWPCRGRSRGCADGAAETGFEGRDHGQERRRVAAVAGQGFIAQGKAFAVDDQADAQLLAIGPMVA